MGKSKALILASGGLDSTACIAHYLRVGAEPECLFVEYGQAAQGDELLAVRRVTEFYGLPLDIVSLSGFRNWDAGEIPGRNAVLITAALMSLRWPIGLVGIGVHGGTTYADCSPNFILTMQAIVDLYFSGGVQIDAPFLGWTKAEIHKFAQLSGCPIELTYSCEAGGQKVCGFCASCLDREAISAGA